MPKLPKSTRTDKTLYFTLRFPMWVTDKKFEAFVKEVKNGKAPESFNTNVLRCLACASNSGNYIYNCILYFIYMLHGLRYLW